MKDLEHQILRFAQNDSEDPLLQILRFAQNDSEDSLFQILRFAQNDNVLLFRMTMQTMLGMTMQSYVEAFPGIV